METNPINLLIRSCIAVTILLVIAITVLFYLIVIKDDIVAININDDDLICNQFYKLHFSGRSYSGPVRFRLEGQNYNIGKVCVSHGRKTLDYSSFYLQEHPRLDRCIDLPFGDLDMDYTLSIGEWYGSFCYVYTKFKVRADGTNFKIILKD